ncbi:hypothetical protein U2F10_23355 [Leptothoe sp. EHU-05/26/07-4]
MDFQRLQELQKTVPTSEFYLGDIVQTEQGLGLVVGLSAWEDNSPTYVSYKVQLSDAGPYEDDDGVIWDSFSAQDSHVEYFYKTQSLTLIHSSQSSVWFAVETESPPDLLPVLAAVNFDGDACYSICDWDGHTFTDASTMMTIEPQPTHWAYIPELTADVPEA